MPRLIEVAAHESKVLGDSNRRFDFTLGGLYGAGPTMDSNDTLCAVGALARYRALKAWIFPPVTLDGGLVYFECRRCRPPEARGYGRSQPFNNERLKS